MHTPSRLIACSDCACHHRPDESRCPHCGSAPSGRPAAALLLGLALTSGCFGKSVAMYGIAVTGSPPTAAITDPADGDTVPPGEVALVGMVSDPDLVDNSELSVSWAVDDVAVCDGAAASASGETRCTTELATGDHRITLEVYDWHSAASDVDEIAVHVSAESN
jgi:hypothetical protein